MAYGELKHRKASGGSQKTSHRLHVEVTVRRNVGAMTNHQYVADACIRRKRRIRSDKSHCAMGMGRTPTKVTKDALKSLGKALK